VIQINFKVAARAIHVALFLLAGVLRADAQAESKSNGPLSFTRDVIMQRFDKNRDGRLAANEKADIFAAFGNIDVPVLPAKPFEYQRVERPSYISADELDQSDNTPADNPITNAGATLGRVLFYDRQLSRNNTVSCASCHEQKAAFSDPIRFSVGFNGGHTKRNAMSLANIRFTNLKGREPGFFWDERAATLEKQVLMPIQDKIEMGMDLKGLNVKLRKLPYYPRLFSAVFGSPQVTSERIAMAVAQFMRAMVSFDSKFDRSRAVAKDLSENFAGFSDQENLGKSLFMEGIGGIAEFACAMCHVPPTFNMDRAINVGLDLKYKDAGLGALKRPSNDPFTPSNDGKFKAPSLRNIELTAPYMHDGRFKTLEQVVEHYSDKVHPHPNLGLAFEESTSDKPTSGLQFNREQQVALVAFLKTLTDKRFVTDPRFSDPFIRTKKKKKKDK